MTRPIAIAWFLLAFTALPACGSSDSSREPNSPDAAADSGAVGATGATGGAGGAGEGGRQGTGGIPTDAATDRAVIGDASMMSDSSTLDGSALGVDATDGAGFDGGRLDASSPRYVWVSRRIDDCSSHDDAALGFTTVTDTPVAANCNANTAGRAAVCWDQINYFNESSALPGCTYKTAASSACTQGPRPGYLSECVDRESAAGLDDTPGPQFGNWRFVRVGDCGGNDVASIGYTTSSHLPLAADCTAANRGNAAVCWDQVYYSNSGVSGPGCTYKSVTAPNCTGGVNPGALYVCDAP